MSHSTPNEHAEALGGNFVQNQRGQLDDLLNDLADELDVSESKYDDARRSYEAVGEYLDAEDSALRPYRPRIYPQGSFELGLAVKPIDDGQYDVDAVCLLQAPPEGLTQRQLKDIVGSRLKESGVYGPMLKPPTGGRRCWTIEYADASRFHLDVLPAVPDDYSWLLNAGVPLEYAQHAIRITDRERWVIGGDWPRSNPEGYARAFRARMRTALDEAKKKRAHEIRADVQSIHDYQVRTPLQRMIQLLKRHRDLRMRGDSDKPISIIITTLAARAYRGESSLLRAVVEVIPRMRNEIEQRDGVVWIPNPVNPAENFADKWPAEPRKQEIFFDWLGMVEADCQRLASLVNVDHLAEALSSMFGDREAKAARKRFASRQTAIVPSVNRLPDRFDVAHREAPKWPVSPMYHARISGRWRVAGPWKSTQNHGRALPKGCEISFDVSTSVPPPYEVHWQVVNTGHQARSNNDLRGMIFRDFSAENCLCRRERTAYAGMHWIECFIVKNGTCLARSGEFVINVG